MFKAPDIGDSFGVSTIVAGLVGFLLDHERHSRGRALVRAGEKRSGSTAKTAIFNE